MEMKENGLRTEPAEKDGDDPKATKKTRLSRRVRLRLGRGGGCGEAACGGMP
ncbi:hypothetical protein EMEDMD4_310063 [Sinorhizobium medicae]|uniref:Uncharacterized protein n=1 Tax=Sinorhizobium medicae TaxID=110321 RepID=A0A508X1I1_9HYPH|nr:hypothetical protein EMEDMD4_310063 [Sinorhizobium medicae]